MKKHAFAPVILVIVIAISGCTTAATTSDGAVETLAMTKPPVQLLRNQAIGRIPTPSVEAITENTDMSVACLSEAEDPEGKSRQWQSAFVAQIVSGAAFRVDAIASNLAQSFTDQGWESTVSGDGSIELTNATIEVSIVITPDAVSDVEARLLFEATSACVDTAGKDSDEVKDLEASTAP